MGQDLQDAVMSLPGVTGAIRAGILRDGRMNVKTHEGSGNNMEQIGTANKVR
jgi:hypothetical protein